VNATFADRQVEILTAVVRAEEASRFLIEARDQDEKGVDHLHQLDGIDVQQNFVD